MMKNMKVTVGKSKNFIFQNFSGTVENGQNFYYYERHNFWALLIRRGFPLVKISLIKLNK